MNLLGTGSFNNSLSLFGSQERVVKTQEVSYNNEKLIQLKNYLNDTFIQPLLVRDFDYINQNKYNFTYLNSQLMKHKHLDEKEVNLYLEIVKFAQECVVILQKNDELEEKLYQNDGFMGIVTHIPSIILKPEFEIYKTFFGMPPAGKFDVNAVQTIKNLLDANLGSTYATIEEKLLDIYEVPEFKELAGFNWAEPCRKTRPNEANNPYLDTD